MKYIYTIIFILATVTYGYSQNACNGVTTVNYAGKTYHTVAIGSQCWLVENIDAGNQINGVLEQTNNDVLEKYCYNDDPTNCVKYGGLYEWAEALQYKNGATNTLSPNPVFSEPVQGICPTGWHIPDKSEFDALALAVKNDGNSLKAVGEGAGLGAGTNTSGFSGLLAGTRFSDGSFSLLNLFNFFVSSTESDFANAYYLDLGSDSSLIFIASKPKSYGRSVRCLMDQSVIINFNCPKSQGYWKNHPSNWPNVLPIMLGTLNNYSQTQLVTILKTPVRGDASIILAYQLIAAKLNVANNSALPIAVQDAIANADIAIGGAVIPAGIRPNSELGHTMTSLAEILDNYNNGLLTPGCNPKRESDRMAPMINDPENGGGGSYELLGNFPNPFNPTTSISFIIPEANFVTLKIYNSAGQLVRTLANETMNKGYHTLDWNAKDDLGSSLASGIYLYRLQAGSFIKTSKMMLMK